MGRRLQPLAPPPRPTRLFLLYWCDPVGVGLLSLEVATRENKPICSRLYSMASTPPKGPLVGSSSPFMRLAQHLTVLWAWCQQFVHGQMNKIRRALFRKCI